MTRKEAILEIMNGKTVNPYGASTIYRFDEEGDCIIVLDLLYLDAGWQRAESFNHKHYDNDFELYTKELESNEVIV